MQNNTAKRFEIRKKSPNRAKIINFKPKRHIKFFSDMKPITKKIIIVIAIVASVVYTLSLRAQISDIKAECNRLDSQIAELDSEEIQLQNEYNKRLSYSSLEEEAKKLGMSDKTRGQVHYINTEKKIMLKL